MRLFLLPISTRQSLLYCQRLSLQLSAKPPSSLDKITTKATTTWLSWEKKEDGWQKKVTTYGNTLFQRLPHEEYGLKSIPPLSERRKAEEMKGSEDVQIEYPTGLIEEPRVQETLRKLASKEKQAYHTKWLVGSLIGMPISAPVALLPVIPNLPFFYLCFRAWSHYRARSGSQHLQFLLDKQLVAMRPSSDLHFAYTEAMMNSFVKQVEGEVNSISVDTRIGLEGDESRERMLLSASSGRIIAERMRIPEMQAEIDRAVWQVKRAVRAQEDEAEKERREAADQKSNHRR